MWYINQAFRSVARIANIFVALWNGGLEGDGNG
jgi:hypothetical protein